MQPEISNLQSYLIITYQQTHIHREGEKPLWMIKLPEPKPKVEIWQASQLNGETYLMDVRYKEI